MKSLSSYFADWESLVFGFGYGTGERPVLTALAGFMSVLIDNRYEYKDVEVKIGEVPAWLLINALCSAGVVEYGSSPRYGWLTPQGVNLKEFILSVSIDDLVKFATSHSDYCTPHYCNCENERCDNPFWVNREKREWCAE